MQTEDAVEAVHVMMINGSNNNATLLNAIGTAHAFVVDLLS